MTAGKALADLGGLGGGRSSVLFRFRGFRGALFRLDEGNL